VQFRGTKLANHPFYSIGIKVIFGSVSGHFANLRHLKRCKTCFRVECTISVYQSWEASILVHWTLNDAWECFGAFCYPLARRKMQNLCSSLSAPFRTKVAKHAFYSIRRKMMFGSVSEHFANLRLTKRCEICVSGLNVLFRCNEVVKHQFYSIGSKIMFGSVSLRFTNIWLVKVA
jgi:hypothetical protein